MRSQKGFVLLEVLIAIAVLGILASGFFVGMNNATKGAVMTDRNDTSRSLAESQMEYVKNQPYAVSYLPDPAVYDYENNQFTNYPGYSAVITVTDAAERDSRIQKINVAISYRGVVAARLDDFKVKR
jgi:prepilin-type N-terminal cleavage/methylation domain-containing protein